MNIDRAVMYQSLKYDFKNHKRLWVLVCTLISLDSICHIFE